MSDVLVFNTPLSIGQKARLMRISLSLTQDDLAALVHVTQQEVSALERCNPLRRESTLKILKFLGLNGEEPLDES